jgi:hypothetical protein
MPEPADQQGVSEPLTLVTADAQLARYGSAVRGGDLQSPATSIGAVSVA